MFANLMKTFISLAAFLFFIAIALLFGGSCANIIPPGGGPIDSIPPRLLSATPPDSTLNFTAKRIVFEFDEYVDMSQQDVTTNLIFTPLFEPGDVAVDVKNKSITVNFKDTLEPNTTYVLNFGNAIKDFNERNVLKNFVYTFSTGPVLDSLELSGRVLLAQTGKVDSTLTVVLHKNLTDSAVRNQMPKYATKLDARGNFRFKNLPSGTFAIYALGGGAAARKYLNQMDLFAFADSTVQPGITDSIILYAYREIQQPVRATTTQPLTTGAQNRLVFTTNLTNNQQDLKNDLVISFASPLRSFDSSRLTLSTDSSFNAASYTTMLDSTRKQLTIRSQWQPATSYNLILDKEFADDSSGKRLLKTDTLFFTTRSEADYGNITIRLNNLDSTKNPILQFVQNDQVIISASIKSGVFTQTRFNPGDYELRILYDTNDNGKWDTGKFFGIKRQPEIVVPLEQKITIKPNWDNTYER